jgi:predicted NAD/FAD-binding protein
MSGRRIAVVGAGVSGLVAARELHRAGHDVSVFEAGDYAGGHTNTVSVEADAGTWKVDTGFIVLNDRNYPNFERLLDELGVATQPASMSFSVSDGRGGFEWASRPRGVFAQGSNLLDPRFHRMLIDLMRFFRDARGLVGTNGSGPTLRAFLEQRGYSEYFVERLIVPQISAIWSANPDQLWSFPASFMAEFLDNHGNLQLVGRPRWRSIPGGSHRYVDALTAPFRNRIHLGTPVRAIRRQPDGVELVLTFGVERFEEVVIATHSDQALAMLADPSDAEHEVLGAIAYQPNEAVLHTDERLLPRRRGAWASWNFHLTDEPTGRTTVTYHMNRLQSLVADRQFLVTLNRTDAIDPARVIGRIPYSHPVYTAAGVRAQGRWAEISGADRTHYCGAYWRWGFHEDGVWSALRVSERLGALERGRRILTAPDRALAA